MQEEFEDKFAKQAKENARLVAKEISAKEASRLKSQPNCRSLRNEQDPPRYRTD